MLTNYVEIKKGRELILEVPETVEKQRTESWKDVCLRELRKPKTEAKPKAKTKAKAKPSPLEI